MLFEVIVTLNAVLEKSFVSCSFCFLSDHEEKVVLLDK